MVGRIACRRLLHSSVVSGVVAGQPFRELVELAGEDAAQPGHRVGHPTERQRRESDVQGDPDDRAERGQPEIGDCVVQCVAAADDKHEQRGDRDEAGLGAEPVPPRDRRTEGHHQRQVGHHREVELRHGQGQGGADEDRRQALDGFTHRAGHRRGHRDDRAEGCVVGVVVGDAPQRLHCQPGERRRQGSLQ
ncbi:MAG: hypothetical protein ACXWDI_14860 [Nocardioides sp.]